MIFIVPLLLAYILGAPSWVLLFIGCMAGACAQSLSSELDKLRSRVTTFVTNTEHVLGRSRR